MSGKPDAGEWARQIELLHETDDVSEYVSYLQGELADFQRETLLWASSQFSDYLTKKTLERLAESCGRGK